MIISTRKAFLYLILPPLFFVIMYFFPENISWTIHQRFDLNSEVNIPTWYSTAMLFLVSIISFGIFLGLDRTSESRRFWLIFAAVYCFLSADEAACIHEAIALHANWMYIYAPFAAAFLVYCTYHLLKKEDPIARNWILAGLIVYGTGVLGLEAFWYFFRPLPEWFLKIKILTEETFETLGSIIVAVGCLHELNRLWNYRSKTEQQSVSKEY